MRKSNAVFNVKRARETNTRVGKHMKMVEYLAENQQWCIYFCAAVCATGAKWFIGLYLPTEIFVLDFPPAAAP